MATMDNANPTVLNASELPTRRGKSYDAPAKQESDSIVSLMQPTTNPAMQIYLDGEEPLSGSDNDEEEEEPIDEQEIFGMCNLDSSTRMARSDGHARRPHLYHI